MKIVTHHNVLDYNLTQANRLRPTHPTLKALLNCIKSKSAGLPSSGRASLAMAILAMAALISSPGAQAQTYTYTGGSGNWSATNNWTPNGTPNAIGAVIQRTTGSASLTQDVVGGVTVGTISNSGNNAFNILNTGGLTLNQNGASAGTASITLTGTSAASRIVFSSTSLVLADDLVVTQNNSNSNVAAGAIAFTGTTGTGNVTFNNVMNDIGFGSIAISGGWNAVGTMTVASGAVRVAGIDPFNSANAINLGVTGG